MTTYWLNQHEFNTLQHSDSLIKHILAEPPIIDVCNPSTFPNLLDVRSIKSDGPGMRSSETKSSGEYSPNAKCVAFKVPDTTKKDKTFAKEPVVCQNEALNEEGSVGFSFVSDSDRADDKNSSSVKSSLILSDSNLPPTLTEYVSPPSASKSSPNLAKCGRPSAVRGHNSPLNVKEHNSPSSSHSRNMVAVEPVFTHFSTSSNKPVLPSYGVQKKLANHRPTVSVVDSKDTTCSTTCILL
ncbi:hypothetical protein EB796_023413 [Bugula neritina]|uniref:Uncharacterized protein n=1 Tax=Bugula neritina TaxID=10212 RepID=A0A7J7IWJ9_BUGNE|nr:hypothetical protein EB796_023413 [Bugula neritina]